MHTPGPWESDGLRVWAARSTGDPIYIASLKFAADTAMSNEERKSNTAVIAAAPDLVVELRNMIAEIRWHEQNAGLVLRGMGSANVEKAEVILAKATA